MDDDTVQSAREKLRDAIAAAVEDFKAATGRQIHDLQIEFTGMGAPGGDLEWRVVDVAISTEP